MHMVILIRYRREYLSRSRDFQESVAKMRPCILFQLYLLKPLFQNIATLMGEYFHITSGSSQLLSHGTAEILLNCCSDLMVE